MSGGKGGGAPDTPDYEALVREQAKAQQQLLEQQTQNNRVNQYTPWGSVTWTRGGFDQEGYDRAMQAYQNGGGSGGSGGGGNTPSLNKGDFYTTPTGAKVRIPNSATYGVDPNTGQLAWTWNQTLGGDAGGNRAVYVPVSGFEGAGGGGGSGGPPKREDFYSEDGPWSQHVELSPEQQALFDQYNRIQQGLFGSQDDALARVQEMMAQGAGGSGLTAYDPTLATNNATDLIMERLNPQLDRRYEQLQARLANQGIAQGSEAWNNALTQFDQGRNDAYNQAALSGIGLGMQQQAQSFRDNAYLRQLPLNELQALMGGTRVDMPQMPSYAQAGQGMAPDLVGAQNMQYNADLNAYNAGQAQQSGMMGGIGSLVGAGIGGYFGGMQGVGMGSQIGSGIGGLFSDRRLKTDIKLIGTADNGLPIYSYRYIAGGPQQIGHIAQDVEKVFPNAVSEHGGYKVVDYSKVY